MTHLLEIILNSIQILNRTFGQCSLGLARFTNVIFMLALPFVIIQYLRKMRRTDEQVSGKLKKNRRRYLNQLFLGREIMNVLVNFSISKYTFVAEVLLRDHLYLEVLFIPRESEALRTEY
jgi:hypothetical protein